MKKIANIIFYTIIMIYIYAYFITIHLKKGSFNFNEIPHIFNIIFIIVFFCGILFIIFKKKNILKDDNKLIQRLEMKIPTISKYNTLINNVKNIYIRSWNINLYENFFFISDLEGNLLYKVKQTYGSIPENYIIMDPYNKVLGKIKENILKLTLNYEMDLYNQNKFYLFKTMEIMENNYKVNNLPVIIKGDYPGFNYVIVSENNNKKVIAEISTTSRDGSSQLGNADIYIYLNQYSLEIISCAFCIVLSKIKINQINNN